jgi:hypothetical protein
MVAIIEAQARMTGEDADIWDEALEQALDILHDHVVLALARWQPEGLPN